MFGFFSYICTMKRIVGLLICLWVVVLTGAQEPVCDATYKEIRYAEDVFNFTNQVRFVRVGDGHINRFLAFLPIPVSNEYQEVSHLSVSEGDVYQEGNYDNEVLYVERKRFPDGGYTLTSTFDVRPVLVKVDVSKIKVFRDYNPESIPCKRHLGDRGKFVMTRHPYIVQTADSLWAQSSNVLDYARRCYEYVASHFRYVKGNWRTLEQILKEGGGECGDFSTVMVSLLRYKGIPSRHNVCLRLAGGLHVWVDFYMEGYGWIPLDVQMKNADPRNDYFGVYDGTCVVMMQDICYDMGDKTRGFSLNQLQTYYFKYWYDRGSCSIVHSHEPHLNGCSRVVDEPITTHVTIVK